MSEQSFEPPEESPSREPSPAETNRGTSAATAKWLRRLVVAALIVASLGLVSLYAGYRVILASLPDLEEATDYHPFLPTVFIDIDGRTVAEYGEQRRVVVAFENIPEHVIQAFLAAEDSTFYSHGGFDLVAIARAAVKNLTSGRVRQGASTITQQVAKTFFLSPERTILRKLRELVLAHQLEQKLSKEDILYLYLNQIYFGEGAYGVESASNIYYGKNITDVTVAEAAILAGLPKAPSAYSPYDYPDRARVRQLYVLNQMVENGFVEPEAGEEARNERVAIRRWQNPSYDSGHYSEQVRRYLVEQYGEETVLRDGLRVEIGMDLDMQKAAQRAVKKGVIELEKRHGYRGPIENLPEEAREAKLAKLERKLREAKPDEILNVIGPETVTAPTDKAVAGEDADADEEAEAVAQDTEDEAVVQSANLTISRPDRPVQAIVTSVKRDRATLALGAEQEALLPLFDAYWAQPFDLDKRVYGGIGNLRGALKVGDLIWVDIVEADGLKQTAEGRELLQKWKGFKPDEKYWWASLRPEPEVQAGLLATDPETAEIRAMVGGYDYHESQFNRAMQARRQPGSSFKPVVYSAALNLGYNPATMVVDSPDVYVNMADDATEVTYWKPKNYDETFYGPMTLREALVRSRNVPTLRIAQDIGLEAILEMAKKLGISSPIPRDYSIALGSSGVSLLDMAAVYTTIDAYGVRRDLKMIRRVLDRNGDVLEQHVPDWVIDGREPTEEERLAGDETYYNAEQVLEREKAYIMIYLLHSVVKSGTGWRARRLGRPAAGKTGTTNDNVDSWFMGFTPDLVAGVWVGFDQPGRNLGPHETGSGAANPIWNDFMMAAHEGIEPRDWEIPENVVYKPIDTKTGYQAGPASEKVIDMPFVYGTEPTVGTAIELRPSEDDLLRMDMTF